MSATVTIAGMTELLAVSRMTLHRMRQAGELPPTIPTNRRIVRWLKSDVDLWLDLDCPKTSDFKALKKTKQQFSKR